jgi:hypothetical protein
VLYCKELRDGLSASREWLAGRGKGAKRCLAIGYELRMAGSKRNRNLELRDGYLQAGVASWTFKEPRDVWLLTMS